MTKILELLALLAVLAAPSAADGLSPLPNVVFILADDVGYTDLPSYRRALDLAVPFETPHLDRLAAEGMLFLDAHQSASVCAPARFSVLTGSHHLRGRESWGIRAPSAFDHGGPHRHRTVGELLQAAGYRTAFVGKEHLGGRAFDAAGDLARDVHAIDFGQVREIVVTRGDGTQAVHRVARPNGLLAHGFDFTFTLSDGVAGPPYLFWRNDRFQPIDPARPADGSSVRAYGFRERIDRGNGASETPVIGPGDVDWDPVGVGRQLADAAVAFLEGHRREHGAKPFLLFYASHAVHPKSDPPIDFDGDPTHLDAPVRGVALSRKTDMLIELDHEVGRILDALDAHGLARDTLVFLSSDNGGLPAEPNEAAAAFGSTQTLRGWKGSPFEGGHRVPLIVRWGDGTPAGSRIRPGTVTRQLVGVSDWVASLHDLTGQPLRHGEACDSASLLPLLFADDPDAEPRLRLTHLVAQAGVAARHDRLDPLTGRLQRWFYLEGGERFEGRRMLFDLATDPIQRIDLLQGLPSPLVLEGLSRPKRARALALLGITTDLANWLGARRGADDLPTTPRIDYSRAERRTPVPEPS